MALKGWQFLDDDGKVQASYLFKDCVLDIWEEISNERLEQIKKYLNEHDDKIIKIERH